MQIVKLAICIDNNDPCGLNRIRYSDYPGDVSPKESSRKYEDWDENDPFIAGPFLPTNMNHVPEEKQAVRIIRYNTEKTTINAEYIAGPFTTNYDFQSQTYAQQTTTTTFNQAGKKPKNIFLSLIIL